MVEERSESSRLWSATPLQTRDLSIILAVWVS